MDNKKAVQLLTGHRQGHLTDAELNDMLEDMGMYPATVKAMVELNNTVKELDIDIVGNIRLCADPVLESSGPATKAGSD